MSVLGLPAEELEFWGRMNDVQTLEASVEDGTEDEVWRSEEGPSRSSLPSPPFHFSFIDLFLFISTGWDEEKRDGRWSDTCCL